MIIINEAKVIPPHENKKTGIFGCKNDDKVVNVKTGRTGVIVKDDGTSGNYNVVTIKYDDNGKEVKVKPMHDAQVSGTWQFLKEGLNESVVLTPDEFGDKYEELYDKMIAERKRLGSHYGSIGQKKSNKYEDAFNEIDDILDHGHSASDLTSEYYNSLSDSYQNKIINILKKVGIRV